MLDRDGTYDLKIARRGLTTTALDCSLQVIYIRKQNNVSSSIIVKLRPTYLDVYLENMVTCLFSCAYSKHLIILCLDLNRA